MATKEQILDALKGASGPISPSNLAKKLGGPVSDFSSQLKRWVVGGLIIQDEDKNYIVTDAGIKALEEERKVLTPEEDESTIVQAQQIAQESHTLTDREKFIELGIQAGMTNKGFLKGATNLVWNRGDPKDLDSVWQGLKEANLDKDIMGRWFTFWAAHIKKSPSPETQKELHITAEPVKKEEKSKSSLAYGLDERDNPVYLGEGLGAMTQEQANELAKIKASKKATGSTKSESPGDALAARAVEKVMTDMDNPPPPLVDETTKLVTQIKAVKEAFGLGDKPDSVDEVSKLVTLVKSLREVFGDNKPAVTTAMTKRVLYDKATGEAKEITGDAPVFFITQPASPAAQTPGAPMISAVDAKGNPLVIDLASYFKLEEHKAKMEQEKESHEVKIEISKTFKDLLTKATKSMPALGGE